jgi:hypothetical protein
MNTTTTRDRADDADTDDNGANDAGGGSARAATTAKNDMRSMLRRLFPSRDCVTLSHPGVAPALVAKLNDVPNAKLPPSFVTEMSRLRQKIVAFTPIKRTHEGRPINGSMFLKFFKTLVDAFNANYSHVAIQDAWSMTAALQFQQAYETSITTWARFARTRDESTSLLTPRLLREQIDEAQDLCFRTFDSIASGERSVEF